MLGIVLISSPNTSTIVTQLSKYKGHKNALRSTLSSVLSMNETRIEIGYIEVNESLEQNGAKIHILQQVPRVGTSISTHNEFSETDTKSDVGQLYIGKYEILAQHLRQIYHIPTDFEIVCNILTNGDDISDINSDINGHSNPNSNINKLTSTNDKGTIQPDHYASDTEPGPDGNLPGPLADHKSAEMIYIRVKSIPESVTYHKSPEKPVPIKLVTSGSDGDYDYDDQYVNKMLEEKNKLMRNNYVRPQVNSIGIHTPSEQYGNASAPNSLNVLHPNTVLKYNKSSSFKNTPTVVAVTPMDEVGDALEEEIDLNASGSSSDSDSSHILEHAQPKIDDHFNDNVHRNTHHSQKVIDHHEDEDNAPDVVYPDEMDKEVLDSPMEEESMQRFRRHLKLSMGDIADDIPDVPNSVKSMGSDVFGIGASDEVNVFAPPLNDNDLPLHDEL